MNDHAGAVLLPIARAAIGSRFGLAAATDETADWLAETGATFVTLRRADELRGCIGTLEPYRPLLEDVKSNAVAAAFSDRRFAPLSMNEWPDTLVEVSLLSALEPIEFADEADALARLRPYVDGIVLGLRGKRSTFLPQVWESLPEPREFLAQLKRKAGLAADFWSGEVKLWRYSVDKCAEQ